ncbi:MAG TPA: outer membrane beta-barrel protein [Candidatus Krumholzibacteria bacterium]|nr:outer membrane beta-barrel protein [Candidatus Krumholzibacteria bacterium]
MKKVLLVAAVFCAVALISASAFAASPLRAVGLEAGYVSPDLSGYNNVSGTWVAGAYLDFGLPATNFYVNPFVNYWNWSDGSGSSQVNFRDWTVGANLKWTIPTAGIISPFIAAGASAHMMNLSVDALSVDQSDTKFGFQTGAGVKLGVSQSASIVGSGWYHMVDNANHWSFRGGLEFGL